jgi:hypothetical protein
MRSFMKWLAILVVVLFGLLILIGSLAPEGEQPANKSATPPLTSMPTPPETETETETLVTPAEAQQPRPGLSSDIPQDILNKQVSFDAKEGLITVRDYLALIAKDSNTETSTELSGPVLIVRHQTRDPLAQTSARTDIQFRLVDGTDNIIIERMIVDGEELSPEQTIMVFATMIQNLKRL